MPMITRSKAVVQTRSEVAQAVAKKEELQRKRQLLSPRTKTNKADKSKVPPQSLKKRKIPSESEESHVKGKAVPPSKAVKDKAPTAGPSSDLSTTLTRGRTKRRIGQKNVKIYPIEEPSKDEEMEELELEQRPKRKQMTKSKASNRDFKVDSKLASLANDSINLAHEKIKANAVAADASKKRVNSKDEVAALPPKKVKMEDLEIEKVKTDVEREISEIEEKENDATKEADSASIEVKRRRRKSTEPRKRLIDPNLSSGSPKLSPFIKSKSILKTPHSLKTPNKVIGWSSKVKEEDQMMINANAPASPNLALDNLERSKPTLTQILAESEASIFEAGIVGKIAFEEMDGTPTSSRPGCSKVIKRMPEESGRRQSEGFDENRTIVSPRKPKVGLKKSLVRALQEEVIITSFEEELNITGKGGETRSILHKTGSSTGKKAQVSFNFSNETLEKSSPPITPWFALRAPTPAPVSFTSKTPSVISETPLSAGVSKNTPKKLDFSGIDSSISLAQDSINSLNHNNTSQITEKAEVNNNYEMTIYESADDSEIVSNFEKQKKIKKIPSWAETENVAAALVKMIPHLKDIRKTFFPMVDPNMELFTEEEKAQLYDPSASVSFSSSISLESEDSISLTEEQNLEESCNNLALAADSNSQVKEVGKGLGLIQIARQYLDSSQIASNVNDN